MPKLFIFIIILLHLRATGQTINLNSLDWKFKKAAAVAWLPAKVPGTVHTDLMDNKIISDPFYRNNEKELQWIDKSDWEYQAQFNADSLLLAKDGLDLKFEGLDTYADVFLNEVKLLQADNMFRSWKINVKGKLKKGLNNLRIYFHSPINKELPVYDSLPYQVPVSNNDQAEKRLSVFTRKAGYHYGWDWGPRFVTSGIWRSITLIGWDTLYVENVFIKQKKLTPEQAVLEANVEVNAITNGIKTIEIMVDGDQRVITKKDILLYQGNNNLIIPFTLPHPELWWPNGMGKQKLYGFKILFKDASDNVIVEKTVKKGLREVELVQESDNKGRSFYFKINGKPVFMKGANYIPQDNFLTRVTKDRYEQIINAAVTSHMNMLRVWGGGVYQSDLFYDLCDEKGILVWQDFMFACALLPPFENLKQNIYMEAVDNIKRLRNHASLVLWCGNNEVVQFFNSGFWEQVNKTWKTAKDSAALFDTYRDIFHQILPAALKAYDNEKPYWSTSPSADNYSMNFDAGRKTGDQHYWGVWGGTDKIEAYDNNVSRFMSEYGFQSFPGKATIKAFADSTDFFINSPVLTGHQRSNRGNAGILEYMNDWFNIPSDFDQFLYVGQLLQSEAMKVAIEAHRRAKPFCMGTLFWQIDDCWPAASWSSIDYFGRWKALQYQSRRSYSTVFLSTKISGEQLSVHLISDSLKGIKGILQIRLIDFNGHVLKQSILPVAVEANGSKIVTVLDKKDWVVPYNTKQVVLETLFKNEQNVLAKNLYYFEKPKNLELPESNIQYTITRKEDQFVLSLNTDKIARFVNITIGEANIVFSDNYFDLLPNRPYKVTFKSTLSLEVIKQRIKIISLKNV